MLLLVKENSVARKTFINTKTNVHNDETLIAFMNLVKVVLSSLKIKSQNYHLIHQCC